MKSSVVFLADGFEEIEALTTVDVLRRADIKCDTCSLKEKTVRGSHGIIVVADKCFTDVNIDSYDAIILPGGMPGAKNLKEDMRVIEAIKKFYGEDKIIAALCAAPIVLAEAGIIENKKVTSFPSFKDQLGSCSYLEDIVVEQENIITSRGPATAIYFALKLAERLGKEEAAKDLKDSMLLTMLENNIIKNN